MPEEPLDCQALLLVEGKDEVNFFLALLMYKIGEDNLDIYHSENKSSEKIKVKTTEQTIRIEGFGGKYRFRQEISTLPDITGFDDVEVLAIVRDADDSADNTFQSVTDALMAIGLPCPEKMGIYIGEKPSVGIFIIPDNRDPGMLEDLCLQTQENHPAMECVDAFFECLASQEINPKNLAKAKCQTFLSSMPEIIKDVGLGAKKGYWDLSHQCLDDLIKFIEPLYVTS